MTCTACGFDNPASVKFCGSCGRRLAAGCSSCGAENPPGFRFCGECGRPLAAAEPRVPAPDPRAYTPKHLAEKILTSRSALEGERKQVTVLFADVKGSMELAEQIDPGGVAPHHGSFLPDPGRRRSPLRGHGQRVPRRRHHGAVRCPDRARRPRAAGLLRRTAPAATRCAATRTSCASARGSTSRCGWASTRERSWSGRSATTCGWTTRRWGIRPAWRRGWSRSPSRGGSISRRRPPRSCQGFFALRDLGRLEVQGV